MRNLTTEAVLIKIIKLYPTSGLTVTRTVITYCT
jgi:hypothetical protein